MLGSRSTAVVCSVDALIWARPWQPKRASTQAQKPSQAKSDSNCSKLGLIIAVGFKANEGNNCDSPGAPASAVKEEKNGKQMFKPHLVPLAH